MERLFDDVTEQLAASKNAVEVDHVTIPVPPGSLPVGGRKQLFFVILSSTFVP